MSYEHSMYISHIHISGYVTLVQYGPDEPSGTRTQTWVQAWMSDYGLNCNRWRRSWVTRLYKKFHPGYLNFDDQARLGKPKIIDCKAMLSAVEVNPVISTQRVSGEFGILQSSVVHHFHDYSKSCPIVPHVTKILQNFWLIQVI